MYKNLFLMTAFCLISNTACSMDPIKLDQTSEANLLKYALVQALRDSYWPVGVSITLESFHCVNAAGNKKDYKAHFYGRYNQLGYIDGRLEALSLCRPRNAYIPATTLEKIGVTIPEEKH